MSKAKEVLDLLVQGKNPSPLDGNEITMPEIQAEMSRRGFGGTHSYGGGYDCESPSIDVWSSKGRLGSLTWK